jgi:mono/diheme cytochrome c family protein
VTRPSGRSTLRTWAALALAAVGLAAVNVVRTGATATAPAVVQSDSDGWQISRDATTLSNPIAATPTILAKGQELYKAKCQRCHGASGKGNGPDADPEHSPGDLTDGSRASRNPDGVMFYKVWNGRAKPKMPAFKADISRDDVWTIIHYVKTLRK